MSTDSVTFLLQFPLGAVAGVVATLAMNPVMSRLPEGDTPPTVAASVLTDSVPQEAPDRLAGFAHYFAGVGTGVLFAWLSISSGLLVEDVVGSVLVASVILYVLMVGFFVTVPLPLSQIEGGRKAAVARDWSVSAFVYVLVVAPTAFLVWSLIPSV